MSGGLNATTRQLPPLEKGELLKGLQDKVPELNTYSFQTLRTPDKRTAIHFGGAVAREWREENGKGEISDLLKRLNVVVPEILQEDPTTFSPEISDAKYALWGAIKGKITRP